MINPLSQTIPSQFRILTARDFLFNLNGMECNLKTNMNDCTCTYEPCARKGRCCECIVYHRSMGELPGCLFPKAIEKTFDRSIERFVANFK